MVGCHWEGPAPGGKARGGRTGGCAPDRFGLSEDGDEVDDDDEDNKGEPGPRGGGSVGGVRGGVDGEASPVVALRCSGGANERGATIGDDGDDVGVDGESALWRGARGVVLPLVREAEDGSGEAEEGDDDEEEEEMEGEAEGRGDAVVEGDGEGAGDEKESDRSGPAATGDGAGDPGEGAWGGASSDLALASPALAKRRARG